MKRHFLLPSAAHCVLFAVLFFLSPIAHANTTLTQTPKPLFVRTQNPLYLLHLAMPMETPVTLDEGEWQTELNTTFSNVFEYDMFGNTQTDVDLEMWRTTLSTTYGLTDLLDVRIDVPVVSNGGGFLDNFLQGYHNLFGFPNAGREIVSNNRFAYQVTHNGTTLADYASTLDGLGDITLRVKRFIPASTKIPFALSVASYLKIPTGSTVHGLGSGHFDAGVSLFAQKTWDRWSMTSQLGGVLIDNRTDLEPILKHGFIALGQSVEYQIADWISTIVQLSGSTPLFKQTDNDDLNKIPLDLNIGAAGTVPLWHGPFKEFFYQVSFAEDILCAGPSVDLSVLFLGGVKF
jgi:hypothetical protein